MNRIEIGISTMRVHQLMDELKDAIRGNENFWEIELIAKSNVIPYEDVIIHFSNDDMEGEETRNIVYVEIDA